MCIACSSWLRQIPVRNRSRLLDRRLLPTAYISLYYIGLNPERTTFLLIRESKTRAEQSLRFERVFLVAGTTV